jgi:hypothetical protein
MRRRIARDADMLDVFDPNTSGTQTILNCQGRKSGAVFDAIEPLFFGCCHNATVFDQRGGGIAVIGVYSEDVHLRLGVRYVGRDVTYFWSLKSISHVIRVATAI